MELNIWKEINSSLNRILYLLMYYKTILHLQSTLVIGNTARYEMHQLHGLNIHDILADVHTLQILESVK